MLRQVQKWCHKVYKWLKSVLNALWIQLPSRMKLHPIPRLLMNKPPLILQYKHKPFTRALKQFNQSAKRSSNQQSHPPHFPSKKNQTRNPHYSIGTYSLWFKMSVHVMKNRRKESSPVIIQVWIAHLVRALHRRKISTQLIKKIRENLFKRLKEN